MTKKEAMKIAWELYKERELQVAKTGPLIEFDLAVMAVAHVVQTACGWDANGNRRVTFTGFMDWVKGYDPLDPSKL